MEPLTVVGEVIALLNRVLDLVDRETAKSTLDRLAVIRANADVRKAMDAKFGVANVANASELHDLLATEEQSPATVK